MAEESLKKQAVRGVGWSFADSMLGQGVTFLVGIVLARMLTPDEYGLIGIITIFITVFNAIVDSGFSNALIRNNNATDKDYNTMFITNLAISILLLLLLIFCAPFIALFFQRPELSGLCRAMSVIVVINALSIVQNTVLTKRLDFKTKTKASFISSVVSGFVGISMAYYQFGVWALVGQQISRQLINTICLYILNRWFPSFTFSIDSFREMWKFGWKLLASTIIDQTWTEIYQVIIGKCYTPATLGLYTRARQFSGICSSNLTSIIQRVSYPTLSKMQEDKQRLKAGYKRVIKITMMITFTLMLGLAGCAKSLILVLIGEQWINCVTMLQIICFSAMQYPLHALNLNMLQVQGRTDLFLKLEIIKKFIAVIPLLLGIYIGIYYMLIGSVIAGIFALYLNAYYSGPYLKYSIWEQVRDIFPSLVTSLSMFAVLFVISCFPINPFLMLPLQILIGATFIIVIYEIRKPEEYVELKAIAIPFISKIKNKK